MKGKKKRRGAPKKRGRLMLAEGAAVKCCHAAATGRKNKIKKMQRARGPGPLVTKRLHKMIMNKWFVAAVDGAGGVPGHSGSLYGQGMVAWRLVAG